MLRSDSPAPSNETSNAKNFYPGLLAVYLFLGVYTDISYSSYELLAYAYLLD